MANDALSLYGGAAQEGANVTQSWINTIIGASAQTIEEYKKLGDDLLQSDYKFSYLVFPNDLGMDDNGHYMIININVPTSLGGQSPAGQFANDPKFNTQLKDIKRSKVDMLRYGSGAGVFGAGGLGKQLAYLFQGLHVVLLIL